MNSEEIKNEFINCIEGTHTLNLAVSILEERDLYHSIIKEVREYIENNTLYEQDYDYDYEENLTEYPPSDEQARKDILEILDKTN